MTKSGGNQVLIGRDLRAAAVLLIAALKAPGKTTVAGLSHLKRGYENLIGNLIQLNANIEFKPDNC